MNAPHNETLRCIFSRRSIRVFTPGNVPDSDVQWMLEAAMAAPSAVAKDPWRFIIVRSQEQRDQLVLELPSGKMLAEAPLGVVVCGDLEQAHDRQLSYLIQDCAAAIENLLLAAHALGYGACWLGVHPRESRIRHVRRVLGVPPTVIPVAVVAIGKPGESKEPRTRFNARWVHQETWSSPSPPANVG